MIMKINGIITNLHKITEREQVLQYKLWRQNNEATTKQEAKVSFLKHGFTMLDNGIHWLFNDYSLTIVDESSSEDLPRSVVSVEVPVSVVFDVISVSLHFPLVTFLLPNAFSWKLIKWFMNYSYQPNRESYLYS